MSCVQCWTSRLSDSDNRVGKSGGGIVSARSEHGRCVSGMAEQERAGENCMEWYNEPRAWKLQGDAIVVTTEAKTDFWRRTRSGSIRDNGHFYYERRRGDFICEVEVHGEYAEQYDQAGLMVRADEANWLKCGIELVDDVQYVSAVITHEYSDWSVVPAPEKLASIRIRASLRESTVEVHYSLDGSRYTLLRVGYLPRGEVVSAGPMAASPEGNGFSAVFRRWTIDSVRG